MASRDHRKIAHQLVQSAGNREEAAGRILLSFDCETVNPGQTKS